MPKSIAGDNQIWFPGPDGWELWLVEMGQVGMIKRRKDGEVLEYESGPKCPLCLALPVERLVAFPFISNALDANGLLHSCRMYVERQGAEFDSAGVMVEPVHGDPPDTLVRVDAPLRKCNAENPCDFSPDLVVPSVVMLELPRNTAVVWKELGKYVVAFDRGGKTVYYDILSGSGADVVAEFQRIAFQLQADQLIEGIGEIHVWCSELYPFFSANSSVTVVAGDRPVPRSVIRDEGLQPVWLREEKHQILEGKKANLRKLFTVAGAGIIGLVFLAGYTLSHFRKTKLKKEIAMLAPAAERVEAIKSRWAEVESAVDPDASCLETWMSVFSLPGIGAVEIERLGISKQEVAISGTAKSATLALRFVEDLSTKESLADFEWSHEPLVMQRDGSAMFHITGSKNDI